MGQGNMGQGERVRRAVTAFQAMKGVDLLQLNGHAGCLHVDTRIHAATRPSARCSEEGPMSGSVNFPLSMADEGARVRVVALRGGAGLDRRMTEMGLNVGSELTVRQRQGGGVVVSRGETRFALGGGMAHKIMVERLG